MSADFGRISKPRPPIESTTILINRRDESTGHVFPEDARWKYPRLGRGREPSGSSVPCSRPYSDPRAVESLLTEIRDLLQHLVTRG